MINKPVVEPKFSLFQLISISAYWFGSSFHWGALLMIILPSQLEKIAPATKAEKLGFTLGISAIVALVIPLITGYFSDRCRSRLGRRKPFVLAGTLINLAGLGVLAYSGEILNYPLYFISFVIIQLGANIASGPYAGLIPDLVSHSQRGTASGVMAVLSQLGTMLGVLVTGYLMSAGQPFIAFAVIASVLIFVLLITLFAVKETPLQNVQQQMNLSSFIKGLWIDPRKHPDFAWVWITRFLVTLGMWIIQPNIQYFLKDIIGVSQPEKTTGYILGCILLGATATGYIGGRISDIVGRKVVVYISNVVIAVAAFGFIFCHSLTPMILMAIVYGFGYGAYYSVDWALGTDVLPDKDNNAAKDMAVWHVSMVLPQTIAPMFAGFLLMNFPHDLIDGVAQYSHAGYSALFVSTAMLMGLAAVMLRNVKNVK